MKLKNIIIAAALLVVVGVGAFFMMSPDVAGEERAQAAAGIAPAAGETAAVAAAAANTGPTWFLRCNDGKGEVDKNLPKKGRCEVFQKLIHNESKGRLVEFAIGYPKDKAGARGMLILPLGISVQQGALIQVDENKPFKVSISHCESQGCFAILDVSEDLLSQMKKGKKVFVIVQSMKPQNVRIEMLLNGFAQALKDIS